MTQDPAAEVEREFSMRELVRALEETFRPLPTTPAARSLPQPEGKGEG